MQRPRSTPAFRLAATVAGLCLGVFHASATPLPAEDFAKIPALQSVTMSPDGKQLVAIIAAPSWPVAVRATPSARPRRSCPRRT